LNLKKTILPGFHTATYWDMATCSLVNDRRSFGETHSIFWVEDVSCRDFPNAGTQPSYHPLS